jgi:hypothetical protein
MGEVVDLGAFRERREKVREEVAIADADARHARWAAIGNLPHTTDVDAHGNVRITWLSNTATDPGQQPLWSGYKWENE